jgi:hypothetical protein
MALLDNISTQRRVAAYRAYIMSNPSIFPNRLNFPGGPGSLFPGIPPRKLNIIAQPSIVKAKEGCFVSSVTDPLLAQGCSALQAV